MAQRSYFYFPETGLNGGTDSLRQLSASFHVQWAVDLLTPTAIASLRQIRCADHRQPAVAFRVLNKFKLTDGPKYIWNRRTVEL
jgi:hypothetical protein